MAAKRLPAAAAAGDFDPKFDWIDNAASYVLRLDLQGFKKDDFRVQVDGAGRLTVRGQRAVGADAKHAQPRCFHKVFQLPPAASLDDISGRFEAGVLTLTVPKRATASAAAAPTTIEELKKPKLATKEEGAAARKPPSKDQVDGAKKQKDDGAEKKEATPAVVKSREEITKDADLKKNEESFKKAMDEAARKVQQQQQQSKRREQEQKQTLTPPLVKAGDVKAKAPEAPTEMGEKPEAAGEKTKGIEQGSLAERVRQHAEEERSKAVVEEAEREKTTSCGGWKERVAGELEELADMKWVDGLVEMARNNKEVVAAAIAAFSLGFLVSQKLFSRK